MTGLKGAECLLYDVDFWAAEFLLSADSVTELETVQSIYQASQEDWKSVLTGQKYLFVLPLFYHTLQSWKYDHTKWNINNSSIL